MTFAFYIRGLRENCCSTKERSRAGKDETDRLARRAGSAADNELKFADLLVQDNGQQRLIDLDSAVVLDKAQLSEFVHEKIHS